MDCKGLKGQALKDCQAKAKIKANTEKSELTLAEKTKLRKEKLEKTTQDLSVFKANDVAKWEKKKNEKRVTSSGSRVSFGGTSLKSKTKIARKKGRKSYRA